MTFGDFKTAISSPDSAAGHTPCGSPNGQPKDLFGLAPARVNRSVRLVRERRPMTNATCGLRGFLSSPSADLQSYLESRLRQQFPLDGSTLCSLSWKAKATPAGRPYCQLVASTRNTSDKGYGLLPTMTARDSRTLKGSQPPKRAKKSGSVLAWTIAKMLNVFVGRLNPQWVAWFMGYPQQWISCAPSETPSSRKLRRSSSEHQ